MKYNQGVPGNDFKRINYLGVIVFFYLVFADNKKFEINGFKMFPVRVESRLIIYLSKSNTGIPNAFVIGNRGDKKESIASLVFADKYEI